MISLFLKRTRLCVCKWRISFLHDLSGANSLFPGKKTKHCPTHQLFRPTFPNTPLSTPPQKKSHLHHLAGKQTGEKEKLLLFCYWRGLYLRRACLSAFARLIVFRNPLQVDK